MAAHVSEAKKQVVTDFVGLINEYPIIAAVNMENLPGKQLQSMREQLRGKVVIRMTKRRLMNKVFDEAEKTKPGISKLKEHLKGMPAILFTKDNPFSLFKTLKKNQSNAPIKAGQTAPNELVVPAGPTGFAPGPIIGELGGHGIKSGIEDGKVVVKEDSVVAKEGDVVSANLAGVLARLGIEPMKVGLDLTAAYEDGEIVGKDVLDIDEDAYMNNIVLAVTQATNLSFNAGIPTKDTIQLMLSTAAADALALAIDRDILTDETAKITLGKAGMHAATLQGMVPEATTEEKKNEAPDKPQEATPEVTEKSEEEATPELVEEKKEEVKPATEASPEASKEEIKKEAPEAVHETPVEKEENAENPTETSAEAESDKSEATTEEVKESDAQSSEEK